MPYLAYKASGVDWLDEVPFHWEMAPLYARYDVALGKMLDSKRVTGESSGRYLRNVDVQWDHVNTEALPEMDFAPWERERYRLRPGDLLVCEGGEVGRTAMWRGEIEECFYQKAIHRVRPRSGNEEPRFLYYVMHALSQQGAFVASGNPNTIDHLTAVQLRHYRLPFGPHQEQRAIAAFLDRETARIDGLVAKKERLIELLQEKRAALITRAVTKGLDLAIPMKDSGVEWLGQIPVHWKVKPLRWTVSVQSGEALPNAEFELTREDGLDVVVIGGNGVMGYTSRANIGVPSLAIGRVGALCGNVHLVAPPAWITDNALVVSDLVGFDRVYLALLLRVLDLNRWASHNAQPLITGSFLKDQFVCAPTMEDQGAIARFLETETAKLDALISKIRAAIDRLKEFRVALISAAVTGKIDVRDQV